MTFELDPQRLNLDDLLRRIPAAANTSHLITWDRLRELGAVEPLTERQHCELLIRLANGDGIPGRLWNALVGVEVLKGTGKRSFSPSPEVVAAVVDELDAIARKKQTPESIARAADAASHNVVQVTDWSVSPRGKLYSRYRVIARDIRGALAFGLLLFLDPARPFGRLLGRCGYSECGKFFFVKPAESAGRQRYSYCSPEHSKAGATEVATRRMQRWRKGRKQR